MDTMKLAVPTMGKAGLKSKRSGHFGRCDCFTIVEMREGDILAIEATIPVTRKTAATGQ